MGSRFTLMKEVPSVTSGYGASSINDLPPEVLSEVASHLDFIDILSLQQTSKKLRESTEAHVVWLALAKKYSARHFHLHRPETRSFDNLKTDELRTWIRKRLVVDQIWRAQSARPHFRFIRWNGVTTTLKLVPRTRWLLVGSKDGSVCHFDLDLESLKRVPLIPPSRGNLESVHHLEIHVDEGASRLEFKLVVNRISNDDEALGGLHVWQVKLEGDGNSLAAELLNSIPYGEAYINTLTLGRHLMACAMFSFTGSWVEVIWWEQCSMTGDMRIRFSTGNEEIGEIHLIGDNKILCINKEGVVRLYTLPEPNHTINHVSVSVLRPTYPTWSYSLPGGRYKHSSPVYYNGTTYRLAVSMGDSIWGLVFPATEDGDPSVLKLSDIPKRWDICALGVCKAYAPRNMDGTGVRIGYSWDDGGGIPTIRHLKSKQEYATLYGQCPVFDEEIGRFVYLARGNIVVVDYFR